LRPIKFEPPATGATPVFSNAKHHLGTAARFLDLLPRAHRFRIAQTPGAFKALRVTGRRWFRPAPLPALPTPEKDAVAGPPPPLPGTEAAAPGCRERGPSGAMPIPSNDDAGEPGIIDRRNATLVRLGTLYGLLLLFCGLTIGAHGNVGQEELEFFAALSAGFTIYFLPSLLVCFVRHRDATGIFVLNLVTGWTLVGWVLALLWAIPPLGKRPR
jgi:hypothetical protein